MPNRVALPTYPTGLACWRPPRPAAADGWPRRRRARDGRPRRLLPHPDRRLDPAGARRLPSSPASSACTSAGSAGPLSAQSPIAFALAAVGEPATPSLGIGAWGRSAPYRFVIDLEAPRMEGREGGC